MVSCYKEPGRGGGNSQSQRSLPRSSGSPSPEAPAWRLEDRAAGTSGEQLPGQGQSSQNGSRGTGQARPGACKAKTPGRGSGEHAGHEHASTRMYSAVQTHMHTSLQPHTATASGDRPPGFNATSPRCDLKQVTQLLWASVASTVKGTYLLLPVVG